MNIKSVLLPIVAAFLFFQTTVFSQNPLDGQRVLVFSKTAEFRHASIPTGKDFFLKLAEANHFSVDTTEDATVFNEKNLKNYRLVVFLNTTGDVLTNEQQVSFERFIQAGGGFVGIHAAADTEHKWPWFGQLVGGYFLSHPGDNVQTGMMHVLEKKHPSTAVLPDSFPLRDEFYDFYNFQKSLVKPLISVDEKSYRDGKMGDFHPLSWFHEFDGGRSFYTNWGHTPEVFSNEIFLKHLLGGMNWAASGPPIDYGKKLRSGFMPEESRFKRTILIDHLSEPTELAVAPDNSVFFIERRGAVKFFDKKMGAVKTVAELDVYSKHEYGLMGLNLDPNFQKNHFVYLYYSPKSGGADTANRLARFVFDEKRQVLDLNSEKIILRVPVKRTDCCHTGGSIDWDKNGNLYLSTGDDINPFASRGYAPIDEREGRAGWDGRSTSSNTNDLRGKILRLFPKPDGTYDIPDGNLFPKNGEKTRPEIFVMGNRNPYRISVDRENGWLYWGEVGPDAGENSDTLGPRGHDEVNQARAAGYFGWPLFVADNRAYSAHSFADSTAQMPFFDPKKPVNNSPHNTGIVDLPPAQPAFIYYPYDFSPEFGKVVGKGGRNAMAGPVYHEAGFLGLNNRFPPFFDKKLFIYDWMRGWVNVVSMKQNGDFEAMERFLPGEVFANPMDMAFGPDGALYMLEYGYSWYVGNDEARLSRIEYVPGNRDPHVEISASKKAGAAPMMVDFSSKGTVDFDGDEINFDWNFNGKKKSKKPNPNFIYKKPGVYRPSLTATDKLGNKSVKSLEIIVGNEPPVIDLIINHNKTFYWNGEKIVYEIKAFDKEDGLKNNGKILTEEDIRVAIDFIEGYDKTMIAQGHQQNTSVSIGRRLIDNSDCKSCHAIDKKSAGPSYFDISKKYKGEWEIDAKLAEKIIKGGSGVWGETGMAAHPQLTKTEAKEMARYIMSLADDKKINRATADVYEIDDQGKPGTVIFSASYTDQGAVYKKVKIAPQTASAVLHLRSATMRATSFDFSEKTKNEKRDSLGEVVVGLENGSFFGFDDLDLTDLTGFTVEFDATGDRAGGQIEIRLGNETGKILATGGIERGEKETMRLPFPEKNTEKARLCFVFKNPENTGKPLFAIGKVTAVND